MRFVLQEAGRGDATQIKENGRPGDGANSKPACRTAEQHNVKWGVDHRNLQLKSNWWRCCAICYDHDSAQSDFVVELDNCAEGNTEISLGARIHYEIPFSLGRSRPNTYTQWHNIVISSSTAHSLLATKVAQGAFKSNYVCSRNRFAQCDSAVVSDVFCQIPSSACRDGINE